jgi:drug/metabolite transporter (DMT)-like permease
MRGEQAGRRETRVSWQALVATLIWGSSFPIGKYALGQVGPLTLVVFRDCVGGLLLLATAVRRGENLRIRPGDRGRFALLSILLVPLHQGLQYLGLSLTTATSTSWLASTSPLFIALLARGILGERLRVRQWAGMGIALLGTLAMLAREEGLAPVDVGGLLVLAAAAAWAAYSVLGKHAMLRYPPAVVSGYAMGMGMFPAVPAWILRGGPAELARLDWTGWAACLYLAVGSTAFAFWLWLRAMRKLPAGVVGASMFLQPFEATLLSALWLGETLTLATAGGGLMILVGVALAMQGVRGEAARR